MPAALAAAAQNSAPNLQNEDPAEACCFSSAAAAIGGLADHTGGAAVPCPHHATQREPAASTTKSNFLFSDSSRLSFLGGC